MVLFRCHMPETQGRPSSQIDITRLIDDSGVDAVVADETAYMSHVFGIRTAPESKKPSAEHQDSKPEGRVPSSGTDTTRSSSGSSLFLRGLARGDFSGSTQSTAVSSVNPLLERDPNQRIGIKKGSIEEKVSIDHDEKVRATDLRYKQLTMRPAERGCCQDIRPKPVKIAFRANIACPNHHWQG